VKTPELTWWDQDDAPRPLDMWAHVRAIVPDIDDHTARHRRGTVTLPWEINPEPGERLGDVVPAWVCCDPACAGVELDEVSLEREHFCCDPHTFVGQRTFIRGRHRADVGRVDATGYEHGPYTPYWRPDGAA